VSIAAKGDRGPHSRYKNVPRISAPCMRGTAVGETSFKTPFLSEGYGSPFFMTWAPLDSTPPKITQQPQAQITR
jgi:hypothetical protein